MIRRKRFIEAEEYSVNTSSIFEDIESFEHYIEVLKKLANRMRACVVSYDRGDHNEDNFSKQMDYLVYKVKESLPQITYLVDGINDQSKV